MARRYELTLTEEQCGVLIAALDLYARIGLGQYGAITDHPDVWARIAAVPGFTIDTVREPMDRLVQDFLGFPPGASHGIHSPKISNSNRVAWDIQQVVRHRVAHDRADAEGQTERFWQTQFDTPRASSGQALPTIERTEAGR